MHTTADELVSEDEYSACTEVHVSDEQTEEIDALRIVPLIQKRKIMTDVRRMTYRTLETFMHLMKTNSSGISLPVKET